MNTKVVTEAKATLELYDLKFLLKTDDLDSGEWLMEISYPDFPSMTSKIYEISGEYAFDEDTIDELLWREVFWFIRKYSQGVETIIESVEVEVEEEEV